MTKSNLIENILLELKHDFYHSRVKNTYKLLLNKLKDKRGISDSISKRRVLLSRQLNEAFNGTVRYGPFRGLKFSTDSWWGESDRANMLLGLYEQEILTSLENIPTRYKTFIDLGAADGYYGIGVLINDMFERSYCFEISETGQGIINRNAILNGVSDRVNIMGIAEKDFYTQLPQHEPEQSVLFVDIEGGEFDLFDKALFNTFCKSIIFIELHDWVKDGDEKIKKLKQDAEDHFSITELTTGARDLSKFEELKQMSDTDRWLICSEGRPRLMTWLRLDPL